MFPSCVGSKPRKSLFAKIKDFVKVVRRPTCVGKDPVRLFEPRSNALIPSPLSRRKRADGNVFEKAFELNRSDPPKLFHEPISLGICPVN